MGESYAVSDTGNSLRLPLAETLLEETKFARESLLRAEDLVRDGTCKNGYLQVLREDSTDLLLFYQRAPHSAVRYENGKLKPLDLLEFFSDFDRQKVLSIRLCQADVGLILLMAVGLRNRPAITAPTRLLDIEALLNDVDRLSQTAVIVMTRANEMSFVYCREGKVAAVYFAAGVVRPHEGSIRGQVIAYTRRHLSEAMNLEVFYELRSPRDENAGQRFRSLIEGKVGPTPFLLSVTRAGQLQERRLIKHGVATIGRDLASGIVIDHPSVSRNHCEVLFKDGNFVVRDCQSANGTLLNGVKVDENRINPGDRIGVGEFEIEFGREIALATEQAIRTIFMPDGGAAGRKANVIFRDQTIALEKRVFSLGASKKSDKSLSGFFMRPIQATIVREPNGTHRLLRAEGGRKVKLNGKVIPAGGVMLKSGSRIKVGSHQFVFMLETEESTDVAAAIDSHVDPDETASSRLATTKISEVSKVSEDSQTPEASEASEALEDSKASSADPEDDDALGHSVEDLRDTYGD